MRFDIISRVLRFGPDYADQGLIFATHFGTPLNLNTEVPRRFKKLVKAARLPEEEAKRVRLYDLRHTHATLLLASGADLKVVHNRLGHANARLTIQTYAHAQPQARDDAAARLDTLLPASKAEQHAQSS